MYLELIYRLLAGTKSDGKRVVDSEAVSAWCKDMSLPSYITSAKSGEGVTDLFEGLVRQFRERSLKRPVIGGQGSV